MCVFVLVLVSVFVCCVLCVVCWVLCAACCVTCCVLCVVCCVWRVFCYGGRSHSQHLPTPPKTPQSRVPPPTMLEFASLMAKKLVKQQSHNRGKAPYVTCEKGAAVKQVDWCGGAMPTAATATTTTRTNPFLAYKAGP